MKRISALLLTLAVVAPNAPLLGVKSGTSKTAVNTPKASVTGNVVFNGAHFVPGATPALYLSSGADFTAGALDPADKTYAIAKAEINKDGALAMTALADATATIDGIDGLPNPFNSASGVTGIAVPADGTGRIAAYIGNPAKPAVAGGNGNVFAVLDDGKTIETSGILKDADGNLLGADGGFVYAIEASNKVKTLAAPVQVDSLAFAAVSTKGWDAAIADTPADTGRGIAIVGASTVKAPALAAREKDHVEAAVAANEPALPIRMDAVAKNGPWGDTLAVSGDANNMINALAKSTDVDLHWNDSVQRLYVGLDVMGANQLGANTFVGPADSEGGIISVGSVKISDAGVASFQSIIKQPGVVNFEDMVPSAQLTRVVAVSQIGANGANKLQARASKIRSMKTSTNKDYLIVNSFIQKDSHAGADQLYALAALPLVANDGRLAKVAAGSIATTAGAPAVFSEFPADETEFVKSTDKPVQIAPNFDEANLSEISDLFVDGDTVYISCAHDTNNEQSQRGLFRSSAIFNADGIVIGWTPAERVGGDLGVVKGAGYDAATGSIYALTSQDSGAAIATKDINTVKVSAWGNADAAPVVPGNPANNLGSKLKEIYPDAAGGIHSIAAFNEATPGFKGAAAAAKAYATSRLSLMAAVGKDTVSLIEAGVGAAGSEFLPTTDFAATAPVSYDPSNPAYAALKDIAPLSCVELSRAITAANTSYLFIGGYNGLAVATGAAGGLGLGNGFDGSGDAVVDLAYLAAVGTGLTSIQQLQPAAANSFKDIRKMVAVEDVVYVMTGKKVYGFKVSARGGHGVEIGRFDGSAPGNLDESPVTFTDLPADAVLNDMVVIQEAAGTHHFILATSKGVYTASVLAGASGGNNFHNGGGAVLTTAPVHHVDANFDFGPALQLNYFSMTRGAPSPKGNLFVLYSDLSAAHANGGTVARYAVDVTAAADARVRLVQDVAGVAVGAEQEIEGVNTFKLSDIRGGFTMAGNTIFQSRSMDLAYGNAEAAGTVMNSAAGAVDPVRFPLSDVYEDNAISMVAAPVVDPATGFVMIPHQYGIIANQ